jgi:HEAT repeat protein
MLAIRRTRDLEQQLRSGTPARRSEAALALAELDSPEAVAALTGALADPEVTVRAAAGLALAALRDPAAIPALAGIVAGWDDPALARSRRAALRALAAFRGEEAGVELARALARVHPVRPLGLDERAALLTVTYAEAAGMAAPRVVRALVALLAREARPAAERATSLLGLFPAESHGPLVRMLRTAPAPEARRRAARALAACRRDTVVAALVAALEDAAPEVRAAAARSLGDMRDPATATALRTAGCDRDERVRDAAMSALRKLGPVPTATSAAAGIRPLAPPSPA